MKIIDYNRILLSDPINIRNRNRSKLVKRLIIIIVIGEKKIIVATLSVIEELEIGQPYKLDNGLEITSVKKPRSCFKKVRT